MMAAIRNNRPYNEVAAAPSQPHHGDGRMAAHTGQIITATRCSHTPTEFGAHGRPLTMDSPRRSSSWTASTLCPSQAS